MNLMSQRDFNAEWLKLSIRQRKVENQRKYISFEHLPLPSFEIPYPILAYLADTKFKGYFVLITSEVC